MCSERKNIQTANLAINVILWFQFFFFPFTTCLGIMLVCVTQPCVSRCLSTPFLTLFLRFWLLLSISCCSFCYALIILSFLLYASLLSYLCLLSNLLCLVHSTLFCALLSALIFSRFCLLFSCLVFSLRFSLPPTPHPTVPFVQVYSAIFSALVLYSHYASLCRPFLTPP